LIDPLPDEKLMLNIKSLVVPLAVIAAACALFSFFSFNKQNTKVEFSPKVAEPEPQTESQPTTEAQPAPNVEDPFKKFLDQKAGSSNSTTKSDNAQVVPVQPGKDPFKEFLDKQKQNSKDQVVSPFGTN
jgi:hypothetical protein